MHYTPPRPLPAEHRLIRLQHWLTLWLVWFAVQVLDLIPRDLAAGWLAHRRKLAHAVLLLRALQRVRPPKRPHRPRCYDPHWVARRLTARSMIGMALKRALRGKSPMDQCRALYAVLANAEQWVARIARRLARRFTKLRRPRHRALVALPPCAAHVAACFADSS